MAAALTWKNVPEPIVAPASQQTFYSIYASLDGTFVASVTVLAATTKGEITNQILAQGLASQADAQAAAQQDWDTGSRP